MQKMKFALISLTNLENEIAFSQDIDFDFVFALDFSQFENCS